MTTKEFCIPLTEEDMIDIKLEYNDNAQVIYFVLNYRTKINDKWHEVYRVDTAHRYLHEQRYWISDKPIPLRNIMPLKIIFDYYLFQIKENYEKYKQYYIQKEKHRL